MGLEKWIIDNFYDRKVQFKGRGFLQKHTTM